MNRILALDVLVNPVAAIPVAVARQRWLGPIVIIALMAVLSGTVVALKLDASASVISGLEKTGKLATASERDIAEEVDQTERTALVGAVANGLVVIPIFLVLVASVVAFVGWLIERRISFVASLTVVAYGMLPLVAFYLVKVVIALPQAGISVDRLPTLVPSYPSGFVGPIASKLARGIDFFNLWCAALIGLGFAAATKWNAFKGLAFGVIAYVILVCPILIAAASASAP